MDQENFLGHICNIAPDLEIKDIRFNNNAVDANNKLVFLSAKAEKDEFI